MVLRTPPLRDVHADRGAKFTEFGGWDMPVEFDSIRTEHEAVRESAGLFDVSHMGEIEVRGPDATELMQRLTTNDVRKLSSGVGQYSAITDESGILIDDTVVYSLDDGYLFVPNAGHDEEIEERWRTHRDEWELDCTIENTTEQYAMFAVQGPDSVDLVDSATETTQAIDSFEINTVTIDGIECLASRTGYTGEDGFELIVPWDDAETVWGAFDCQPCGLGARDTLRLEQGFLLSGQDFHHEENPRTPFEAGISFVVALDTEFVGRDELAEQTDPDEQFVGIELTERGVPRHGYDIVDADERIIGTVTSGTMSPTLERPIALGYVPAEYADPETDVWIDIRGREKAAYITNPPFEHSIE
ncbi:glycine cleavage system aminomethyltransferase GcvT [Halocatena marina]|uniref:glycine cleavage system aminomethyltransferase GcvT n=1 Tax=Halocatena marina TaxID=2934937 RepID=UPI0022256E05|nr:glycine cleavage system aminomethyltransferase GcvT [Halocatena marina]